MAVNGLLEAFNATLEAHQMLLVISADELVDVVRVLNLILEVVQLAAGVLVLVVKLQQIQLVEHAVALTVNPAL